MGKTWKVEEKFRNWGKPPRKTNDEFADWIQQTIHDDVESTLEEELKELFIQDLYAEED